jgi:hypothetical protein
VVTATRVKFIVASKLVAATLVAATLVAATLVAATLMAARTLPENSRFPISSDQSKKWPSQQNRPSSPWGKKCPLPAFPLPESSFLKLFCALPTVERRTSSVFSPSLQGDSSCTIANEFQDDLIDDGVRKGRKSAERSTVSARKTVMT